MTYPLPSPLIVGGPGRTPRRLRDELQRRVDAAPPGSAIDWTTYYFRDLALAEALIRAADRGVAVRLVLERGTRRRGANDAVLALLERHGLHGGLRVRARRPGLGHLHAKIYAFSDPPCALVGSFNPSGNEPEDAAVIAEIGDQDRGWNLLVPLSEPALVEALAAHVRRLGDRRPSLLDRFRADFRRPAAAGGTTLFVYPRLRTKLVEPDIAAARTDDTIHAAVSHLKHGPFADALCAAARRGADVSMLLHATERRVPAALVRRLTAAGIAARRIGDGAALPMHCKFVVVRGRFGDDRAWLGSYNYNGRSRFLNDELLVRTRNARTVAALDRLFDEIAGHALAPGYAG